MKEIKFAPSSLKVLPNILKFPVTKVTLEEWNELVSYYNKQFEEGIINRGFISTPSGAISVKKEHLFYNNSCYEVREARYMHELVICSGEGRARVQYDHGQAPQEKPCSGHKAYCKLKRELAKDGIDITQWFIKDGKEIAKTIPMPMLKLMILPDVKYTNAYHIDINSAYPYAMTRLIPEWTKTIERIYKGRAKNKMNKSVLVMSYGWFQCRYFGYKLAQVSKYCIEFTIDYLNKLTKRIEKHGSVIAYNVDGIWFQCENEEFIKELEEEASTKLGDFKVDHKNCDIRFKSIGSYEYLENGVYTPVVRGRTNLDDLKPRTEWKWGDIYNAIPHVYYNSTDEYGIILVGDEFE